MYLDKLERLLKQTYPKLITQDNLTFKKSFGAVAGYVQGKIFISCGKFGVALKLPPKTLEKLFKEKGVRHLKYFAKGHIKKEYAVLPKRITDNKKKFKRLIEQSIDYVLNGFTTAL